MVLLQSARAAGRGQSDGLKQFDWRIASEPWDQNDGQYKLGLVLQWVCSSTDLENPEAQLTVCPLNAITETSATPYSTVVPTTISHTVDIAHRTVLDLLYRSLTG